MRRMASCDCRTRCALLCRSVRLAGDLNDDALAITADVGEAPGEANPKRSLAPGKHGHPRRDRQAAGSRARGKRPVTTGSGLADGFPDQGGEAKTGPEVPKDRSKLLIYMINYGAGEGIRTLDPNLGKVVLYP
jgi:hypothetical protein